MALSTPALSGDTRLCPFCGKPISVRFTRCPICREEIPNVNVGGRGFRAEAREKMRRGLFYILLAAIIHYFAAGYSTFTVPVTIPAFVTAYLTPLLFLAGIGFEFYGGILYLRS